jgi:branched-chain amino acid aminotransferase
MDTITGSYYVINDVINNCSTIDYKFPNEDYQFYEVIRTSNGIPVFLHDHLNRLKESLVKLKISENFNEKYLIEIIFKLLDCNSNLEGNIKILYHCSDGNPNYAAYYIPHKYPTIAEYNKGIKLVTCSVVRENPQIKQVHINEYVKKEIEEIIRETSAYEVLMIK